MRCIDKKGSAVHDDVTELSACSVNHQGTLSHAHYIFHVTNNSHFAWVRAHSSWCREYTGSLFSNLAGLATDDSCDLGCLTAMLKPTELIGLDTLRDDAETPTSGITTPYV